MNQVETESIAQLLKKIGFELSDEYPQLIFVNTCCVTGRAEAKSRRFVGRLAKTFPSSKIIAAGCLAELKPEDLVCLGENIQSLGTVAKDRLLSAESLLDTTFGTHPELKAHTCHEFSQLPTPLSQDRSRAFLKIQDGCSQRCSYCIVPTTRGPSRSKNMAKALQDVTDLENSGFPEIVLTGIHLGAYGRDLNPESSLEEFVSNSLNSLKNSRLRMSSIEPQEISERLIDMVAEDSRLCNHFHIPIQSMDDSILKAMGRPYSCSLIQELISRILIKIPEACIGADIMVGFPGEDDTSFGLTYEALQRSGLSYLHVFPFSKRPGAPASNMKGTPDRKAVAKRVLELRDLSSRLRDRFYGKFLGSELQACLESGHQGAAGSVHVRTDNYITALLLKTDLDLKGRLFKIRLDRIEGEFVSAILV